MEPPAIESEKRAAWEREQDAIQSKLGADLARRRNKVPDGSNLPLAKITKLILRRRQLHEKLHPHLTSSKYA